MSAPSRRLDGVCVALVTDWDETSLRLDHVRGRVVSKFAVSRSVGGGATTGTGVPISVDAVSGTSYSLIDLAFALFCVRRGLLEILMRRRRLALFDVFALISRRTDMRSPLLAAAVADDVAANGFRLRRAEPSTDDDDGVGLASDWAVRMSDGTSTSVAVSAVSKAALFDVFAKPHNAATNFAHATNNQFSGATNIFTVHQRTLTCTEP